jgi:hypothetical protein
MVQYALGCARKLQDCFERLFRTLARFSSTARFSSITASRERCASTSLARCASSRSRSRCSVGVRSGIGDCNRLRGRLGHNDVGLPRASAVDRAVSAKRPIYNRTVKPVAHDVNPAVRLRGDVLTALKVGNEAGGCVGHVNSPWLMPPCNGKHHYTSTRKMHFRNIFSTHPTHRRPR